MAQAVPVQVRPWAPNTELSQGNLWELFSLGFNHIRQTNPAFSLGLSAFTGRKPYFRLFRFTQPWAPNTELSQGNLWELFSLGV